jgi:hypothetical protein
VIAIVAVQLLDASVNFKGHDSSLTNDQKYVIASQNSLAAVIFMLALAVMYTFTSRYSILILIFAGALSGQFLFV